MHLAQGKRNEKMEVQCYNHTHHFKPAIQS